MWDEAKESQGEKYVGVWWQVQLAEIFMMVMKKTLFLSLLPGFHAFLALQGICMDETH